MTDDEIEGAFTSLLTQIDRHELTIDRYEQTISQQNQIIESLNHRMSAMAEELSRTRCLLDVLLQSPAEAGTFPPLAEIQRMQVQVFHSPQVTLNERKGGRSEWSLKIEFWHRNKRQKGIDIALVSLPTLRNGLVEKGASSELIDWADTAPQTMLGGMVRRSLAQGGRAYDPRQVAFLDGYNGGIDDVVVGLLIDGEPAAIRSFVPAKGEKQGAAIWFGKWTR